MARGEQFEKGPNPCLQVDRCRISGWNVGQEEGQLKESEDWGEERGGGESCEEVDGRDPLWRSWEMGDGEVR